MTTKQQSELLKTMIENSYINPNGVIWMSINKDNIFYEVIKQKIKESERNGY